MYALQARQFAGCLAGSTSLASSRTPSLDTAGGTGTTWAPYRLLMLPVADLVVMIRGFRQSYASDQLPPAAGSPCAAG